jgi:transposase
MSKRFALDSSFERLVRIINEEINEIDSRVKRLIESDCLYKEKKELMMQLPGIGEITASKLLALTPELGYMTRHGIANLAGVAPHPYDSGNIKGYRKTRGGREDIKKTLYVSALSAMRSKDKLGDYYRSLIARGKKSLVAMVALARKIIVILNARIRDLIHEKGKSFLV